MNEHQESEQPQQLLVRKKIAQSVKGQKQANQPLSLDEGRLGDCGITDHFQARLSDAIPPRRASSFHPLWDEYYYDREGDGSKKIPFLSRASGYRSVDQTLKDAGFKRTIMVVKHHDGFLLCPSSHNDHTIAVVGRMEKGDVPARFPASPARRYGLPLTLGCSQSVLPCGWNRDQYNEYHSNQLKEILEDPKIWKQGQNCRQS